MRGNFAKTAFLSIGIIAGSFIVFAVAAIFLTGQIDVEGAKVLKERRDVAVFNKTAERLAVLRESAPTAETLKKKMDALLPGEDQLFGFQNFMNSIAGQNQVHLTFAYQGEGTKPQGGNPGFNQFAMTATGQLQNLQDFLQTIEKKSGAYWIGIDSFDLTKTSDGYSLQAPGKVFFK